MMMTYDVGLFDVDHTKPATQAADRSTRSRSNERDKAPPATMTSPESKRTTASAAGSTRPPTTDTSSSRLKSGVGAKGR